MDSNPLLHLPAAALARLQQALAGTAGQSSVTGSSLRKFVPGLPADCVDHLVKLAECQWTPAQIGELVGTIAQARETRIRESHLLDLVISGPEHPAVPTKDTAAVYRELIQNATREIVLASFAIYNGKEIFMPLVERRKEFPNLQISLFLDIPRQRHDTTLSEQLVAGYRHDFLTRQWPGGPLPRLFHHRPSLEHDWKTRSSMHAKVIVVDRERAFVSSANLTKAAHSKNIEVGTLIESPGLAARLVDYFEGLFTEGVFSEF